MKLMWDSLGKMCYLQYADDLIVLTTGMREDGRQANSLPLQGNTWLGDQFLDNNLFTTRLG